MNKTWDKIYKANSFRHKNLWPSIDIVSFTKRYFGEVKNKKKINILELGCGWGNNLRFFKEERFNYYGIEQSKTAVNYCKKRYKNIVHGDFSKIDKYKNYFNCVFDRQALQHNNKNKIKKTLLIVKKSLKKDGYFFSEIAYHKNVFTFYFNLKKIKSYFSIFSNFQIYVKEVKSFDRNGRKIGKQKKIYQIIAKK